MEYVNQNKLTKEEWTALEVPLPLEQNVLSLISDGFADVNIVRNWTPTLHSHLKISMTDIIEKYIYIKYFETDILNIYAIIVKKN